MSQTEAADTEPASDLSPLHAASNDLQYEMDQLRQTQDELVARLNAAGLIIMRPTGEACENGSNSLSGAPYVDALFALTAQLRAARAQLESVMRDFAF